MSFPVCSICNVPLPHSIEEYAKRQRVTSDCKTYPPGGRVTECVACGAVQKPNDAAWQADCERIYAEYDNYSLSGGVEQSVRGGDRGQDYAPRSNLVLSAYARAFGLPETGWMLDYGCGKGPSTKAADQMLSGWRIDGFDLDRRAEKKLKGIAQFGQLFTGDPAGIPHRYDLIVLMHALEHIPNGSDVLRSLGELLKPNGHIVLQVPNRLQNPYDLLVADHTLHFDRSSLYYIGEKSGLTPMALSENWVAKELSMVLGHGDAVGQPPAVDCPAASQVDWLSSVSKTARDVARHGPFGIFGTSIIGTWLASEIDTTPAFWIDEDTAKQGATIDGAPVVSPEMAPAGSTVILAMAPEIAQSVAARLAHLRLSFVIFPKHQSGSK